MTVGEEPNWGKERLRFVSVALIAYVLLGVFLAFHHEAWRDEADSWLLARDGSAAEIWERLGYKGTPGLWTAILVPFARMGVPFEVAGLVHVVIAALAGFVLLRYAPFSRLTKLLILFSYLMGYEYLAIARNYAVGIFLLFVLAALDRTRYERPVAYGLVLGLLANCNVHSLFIATAVGLVLLAEAVRLRRFDGRVLAGLATAVLLGVCAVIQVWPPADGAHGGLVYSSEWRALRWSVSQALFPGIKIGGLHWVAFPVFGAAVAAFASHRRALLTFLLGWAGLLYVMTFKVVGGTRHLGLVLMLLLWALWISHDHGTRLRDLALRGLQLTLAIGVVTAGYYWVMEYRYPFSGAKEMASWIRDSGLTERRIGVHLPASGSAVLAYCDQPRTFWYPALGESGSYMLWNRGYEEADRVSHATVAIRVREEDSEALLLLNHPLDDPLALGYSLLHSTDARVFEKSDETFFFYEPMAVGSDDGMRK